jgi:hypothetical protein
MTEEQRNELLGLIVGQCDCLRDDPNEANAAIREVELWRAVEAMRYQIASKQRR